MQLPSMKSATKCNPHSKPMASVRNVEPTFCNSLPARTLLPNPKSGRAGWQRNCWKYWKGTSAILHKRILLRNPKKPLVVLRKIASIACCIEESEKDNLIFVVALYLLKHNLESAPIELFYGRWAAFQVSQQVWK